MISLYTTKPGGLLARRRRSPPWPRRRACRCNVNGSHETGVGNAANLHLVASTAAVTEAGVFPATTVEGKEPTEMAGRMYLDDIVTESFAYEDGELPGCPTGPGLGVELDPRRSSGTGSMRWRCRSVAVLGAGNGGCAAAADLADRGYEVRLFSRARERLDHIRERGGLQMTGLLVGLRAPWRS